MVTTSDRQRLRTELVSQGYSWEYVDEWQPKTTLYRRAAGLDVNGGEAFPVGTPVKGVPGNPDYVTRKGRIGMLPYPPSNTCECKWCSVRNASEKKTAGAKKKSSESPGDLHTTTCNECGESFETPTSAGSLSALRVHTKIHSV